LVKTLYRGLRVSDVRGITLGGFLDAIPLPAWINDIETRTVVDANDAFVALSGRSREELVGSPVAALFAESERARVFRIMARLVSEPEGKVEHVEPFRVLTKGGGIARVRIWSNAVPQLRKHARLLVAHDIQHEEDERLENDERWRTFVEMCPLPAAITRVDPDSIRGVQFLVVNDALAEMTGFSKEELLATPPIDLIHPDDRRAVFRDSARAEGPPGPVRFDARTWRHARKDGTYFDVHIGSVALTYREQEARVTVLSDVSARRRTEQLVAQSEQRYRTVFEVCPVAACIYDLGTLQFRAVNEAMVRQYGYSREEFLRMTVFDLVSPDDAPFVRGVIEDLRDGLRPGMTHHARTIRHRTKSGEDLDIDGIAAPLVTDGRKERLVLHNDITAKKRAEAELVRRARNDALRAELGAALTSDEPLAAQLARIASAMEHHLDLASVGVWVIDEVTGRLRLQARAGALDEAIAGGTWLDLGDTWIGRAAASPTPLLLDVGDPSMLQRDVKHARDLDIDHLAGFPMIVRRRSLGVITTSRDAPFTEPLVALLGVTATQVAQALATASATEALRLGESLSRAILDNMLSALVTLDEDGVIETANPAAEEMFGMSAAELVRRPFASLLDVSLDPGALLAAASGRLTEWRGRRKSGELFPCEMRLFHLESLRGPGYAAIMNDVSERYEVERMKTEFVSVVSHELRTPLTALRGSIGLLTGGVLGELPAGARELLDIAERNALRLISLVNDILDLERLQKGKMELFVGPVSAWTIVERSLESVAQFAAQEHIRLEIAPEEAVVRGDGDRLVQVLVNLLSNAVKFSPPGGVVQVSTTVLPAEVEFRVTDHGRGVPAAYRKSIFERFHQVHTSDSREKGGTGLGLAISKAIVEQHGGSIGVESEDGKGSAFWFRVPRAR
jgi:PAS domain S-box-containing protein